MDPFLEFIRAGFRFNPTDEQLVSEFLVKKINNKFSLVCETVIPECDLYGKQEPWQIWDEISLQHKAMFVDGDVYFFTQLKTKSKGSRILRSVGNGTWHGEDKGRSVKTVVNDDNGHEALISATKKRFSYRNQGDSVHHGRWIMHEFSLVNANTNWVLCRLRNNHIRFSGKKNSFDRILSGKRKQNCEMGKCPDSIDTESSKKRLRTCDGTGSIADLYYGSNPSTDLVAQQDLKCDTGYIMEAELDHVWSAFEDIYLNRELIVDSELFMKIGESNVFSVQDLNSE